MDSEKNNDEPTDNSSQSQQGSEQTPTSKLRDLRPEKDPMGSGRGANKDQALDSKGSASES